MGGMDDIFTAERVFKLSEHRLMIVPCENNYFPCSSFVCPQPTIEKFYVGNPHSGGLYNYPVFCKACLDHMVSHLPAEFSPDGAQLEAHLRAEISLEYDVVLKERVAAQEKQIRAEVTAQLIEQFTKPEVTEKPVVVAEAEEQSDIPLRCLDCGLDFENLKQLEDHKKTHDAPAKNKGGRPPKAKA